MGQEGARIVLSNYEKCVLKELQKTEQDQVDQQDLVLKCQVEHIEDVLQEEDEEEEIKVCEVLETPEDLEAEAFEKFKDLIEIEQRLTRINFAQVGSQPSSFLSHRFQSTCALLAPQRKTDHPSQ
ncbi:hypothetical protein Zmor_025384 [Zophobas morio]|uniref:Uncharacterized protein n=1 Tax=Zophobas morio TaxID=2755281 RepID=A0AA38M414_9CUCU|nr:hypothetical protein Zmor_025384 [Zophobas morio]